VFGRHFFDQTEFGFPLRASCFRLREKGRNVLLGEPMVGFGLVAALLAQDFHDPIDILGLSIFPRLVVCVLAREGCLLARLGSYSFGECKFGEIHISV